APCFSRLFFARRFFEEYSVTATLIDGNAISAQLRTRIATRTAELKREHALVPGLAVILVGDDPASQVYVNSKSQLAKEAGIHSVDYRLSSTTSSSELIALLDK